MSKNLLFKKTNDETKYISYNEAKQIKISNDQSGVFSIDIPTGYRAKITFELDDTQSTPANSTNIKDINKNNYGQINSTAGDVIDFQEFRNKSNINEDSKTSSIYKSEDIKMKSKRLNKSALIFPLVQFDQITRNWNNFTEFRSTKAVFVLLGSILSLFFGSLTTVSWIFFIMTIIHFIMRSVANRYRNNEDYVSILRSTQLFLWPYILLIIGNLLSNVISFNGLPEGTFITAYTLWLVWAELKGSLDNARIAELPIPPILNRLVYGSNNDFPLM